MPKELTLGSLFDGIGGWQLAAVHAGVRPVWSSEIEQFPMQVTKKWFPNTKQLGDITKLDGAKLEPVDIICAGSPCQDLSIAGKREGLKGERSGLFVTAINIVRRMRLATGGQYPRFFVWENVPGAFSSNSRQDFRAVLEEIGQTAVPMPESDRWASAGMVRTETCDIAWRVLDAQYWGVPQRRKRIFLVADFAKKGRCAGEILFEREGVPRDSAEGKEAGKRVAKGTQGGTYGTSSYGFYPQMKAESQCFTKEKQPTLVIGTNPGYQNGVLTMRMRAFGDYEQDSKASALKERDHKDHTDLVVESGTYSFKSYSEVTADDIGSTLKARTGNIGGQREHRATDRR